jgi:hypothetical protein
MSPTQRSLAHLRALAGDMVGVVEKRIPYQRITQDLFGFADIVAVLPGVPGTTYVQTTDGSNVAHRLAKMRAEPVASRVRACLAAGNTALREVVITAAELV